jgi:hypothetical protein
MVFPSIGLLAVCPGSSPEPMSSPMSLSRANHCVMTAPDLMRAVGVLPVPQLRLESAGSTLGEVPTAVVASLGPSCPGMEPAPDATMQLNM